MEFRLLGPLEVAEDGRTVALGGSRARALLALLLVHRNEVLPLDRIVDELWGEHPPKTAEQAVRVYVSQLRKVLEPDVLVTRGPGYLLQVDPTQVDVEQFEVLRADGRRLLAAGDPSRAAGVLGEALSLWRGSPLQDFAYESFAQSEIARLTELRLATLEDRFEAQLAAGHDAELVADLEQFVEANPLRERPRAQLMLALYRSGRQAAALDAYKRGRRLLVDELGLEPSDNLRRLEKRILRQDPDLDGAPSSPAATGPIDRTPPRSRRIALAGIAALVLAAAVGAGVLIAATTGSSSGQPGAASIRVALVENARRSLTDQAPVVLDEINGLNAAAANLGVKVNVLYGGDRIRGFLQTLVRAARTSGLVIVGETPDLEAVSEVTRRFPATRFVVPDSVLDRSASFGGQRNVTGITFDDRGGGYLGGYLAGLMTRGGEAVSAVGGRPTRVVRSLIAGFAAGARQARPGIHVLRDFTGTFTNQNRCETVANRQIDRGSAVVFDAAGDCGFGALQAAAIRGIWGIGIDTDLSYLGPQILGSVVKQRARAIRLAITLFASGELPGGKDLFFDLANDGIGLVLGVDAPVPAVVRSKLEAVAAKLRDHDQSRASH